ncbi:MAG: glycosyltransferase family 1 protein [Pseudomonadales bacterium]
MNVPASQPLTLSPRYLRRLVIVTDAWTPQTNGVVTTLQSVIAHLGALGVATSVIHPGLFKSVPLPGYREIPIVINPQRLTRMLDALEADAVHIATEGSLGLAARRLMVKRGRAFTTSLHTKFPEYFNERVHTPLSLGYRIIRWFHRPAARTLCTTASHCAELERRGLSNLVVWGRGVDTDAFVPDPDRRTGARPRLLYVGRVSVEKNLEAFLSLDLKADKVVVGDGPARAVLERRYPQVQWLGFRKGAELVTEYAAADAFVFPSRTDTFGLVMLEANACGTPVAAYPVTGPKDVVIPGVNGALDVDLGTAVRRALLVSRASCRRHALENGWRRIAERFVAALVTTDGIPSVDPLHARTDNGPPWQPRISTPY